MVPDPRAQSARCCRAEARQLKRYAPATQRNGDAIAEVLETELPVEGSVLEIASGTGEHAVHFAGRFPGIHWIPSDADEDALASITARRDEANLPNLALPLEIEAAQEVWPIKRADAIFCANMIHISHWVSARGLFHHAGKLLAQGNPLILYGPFVEPGLETAPSNLAFDESLRARNPAWGIRSLNEVDPLAEKAGFVRAERYEMPANNLTLVYRRI